MGLYEDDFTESKETEDEYADPETKEVMKKVVKKVNNSNKKTKMPQIDLKSPILSKIIFVGLGIILIAILVLIIVLFAKPNYLKVDLDPNPSILIDGYSSTNLKVSVTNITDYDLKNIKLSIKTTDENQIAIIPEEEKIIQVIGPDETRNFNYELGTIGNVVSGKYALNITLKTNEDVIEKRIFWEIKNRK